MIQRKNIRGFTVKLFSYYVEIVTIKHIPRVLDFGRNYKTITRLEIWAENLLEQKT